jgi:hypothetical protein
MTIQAGSRTDVPVAHFKLIERICQGFKDDVCSGYLTYYDEYQGKLLTNLDMYTFLAQNIRDMRGTIAFNADSCTGWIEALIENRKVLM